MFKRNTKKSDMQGLENFLSDIRNSNSTDDVAKRVAKELAHIRVQFEGSALLDGYNKKKYICKLVFIFLLGYDFDFGERIAINLLNASRYSEKSIGYMFVSVVMNQKSNLMVLVYKAIENELIQSAIPEHQILALNYVANMAQAEIVDTFASPVMKMLFEGEICDTVKQSAILCLLRLFRLKPDVISGNDYPLRIINYLNYPHLGVVTAAVSLIEDLVIAEKVNNKLCLSFTVSKLTKLLKSHPKDYVDYTYYHVTAPWLTVKLLRLLRQFSFPAEIVAKTNLVECIETIFNKVQEPPKAKRMEHRNAKNAVMFEAISLVYHMKMEPHLQISACNILEMSLKQKDANNRGLVLEAMSLLSESEVCRNRMKEQLQTVFDFMEREKDVCIRRKLIDLLYKLCDQSNVLPALDEMAYLVETEDLSLKEEIVLKMSVLAEKFLQDRTMYIDAILNILKIAGEFVSEAVWCRFIQIITNEDAVQSYAAKSAFEAIETPRCHEKLVTVVGYILGEFGNLIAGDAKFSPSAQLRLLHSNFNLNSKATKAALLTTYMKFFNLYPNIHSEIKDILKNNTSSSDPEIQQRAVEYLTLCEKGNRETLIRVFEKMPQFKKGILVEESLHRRKLGTTEINPQETPKIKRGYSINYVNQSYVEENATSKYVSPSTSGMTKHSKMIESLDLHNALQEIFSKNENETNFGQHMTSVCLITNLEALNFLIWHENGTLYESNILCLNTNAKFEKNKGQMRFIYTNKTSEVLSNFRPLFATEHYEKIKIEVTPCATILEPYGTIEQEVHVECMTDFYHKPSLSLSFVLNNVTKIIPIYLPVTMNKFIGPVTMTLEEFCSRWERCQNHEIVAVFPAKNIMERRLVENKIKGIGLMLLQNIDPSKENFVAAGVFHSKSQRIGILLRLESDCKTSSYRLWVRSTLTTVSEEVARLVKFIL